MKKVMYTIMIGASIVLTSCGGEAKTEEVKESKEMAVAQYACPMECEGDKTYNAEGACPVCGMEMTEVK
jgi:hypothetical protein